MISRLQHVQHDARVLGSQLVRLLAQINGHKAGALPEFEQIRGKAIGGANIVNWFWCTLMEALQQDWNATTWTNLLSEQIKLSLLYFLNAS